MFNRGILTSYLSFTYLLREVSLQYINQNLEQQKLCIPQLFDKNWAERIYIVSIQSISSYRFMKAAQATKSPSNGGRQ